MKIKEYNDMMAYLTRPSQQETSVERLGMMAGGIPSLKFMIDFILKFGPEVSKVGGKISREFLEFMGEKNPQNILNVYEDVRKKLQKMGDVKQKINVPKEGDVKIGEAPKTDLKKVKSKVEADKRITQELADEGQIEVNEETASDMTEFMKKNDPEGFKKIQKIVDDINNKKTPVESPYKFTGDETLDDLYELEEKGIISRSDYNVYGERYLDYVDAQVAKMFGYTEQEVNKMPIARLNVLRAKANPNWAEANYGDDYMRILEKERAIEAESGAYDDPGMFDNMFNKMQEEMDDYIPGEKPLTKKKRTLNAGGGLIGGRIGFDVGGFGQSKILRQFIENSIESGNNTFESIADLTNQADVDLGEKAVVKILKEYPNKIFTDVEGTKFPLGYDDENLKKLKEGMNLLKEWEKNPTPENWAKTFQVTEPSGQKKQSKFGQGLRNYLQGKKGQGDIFHKYFEKIDFDDTIKKEVKTYDKKLFNKIKANIGSAAARTSTLETSAAVARTVGETFLRDPEDTNITDIAKALHGKKFDNASDIQKVEMLQDARNGVFKFYQSLTTNRPIGLRKKINGEQFLDIIENIETNSNDFGFQEGQIRDLKMKIRDDILGQKDPAKFFRNLRNNVEVPKGKIIDEVFSLSGTYKRAPGYLDQIQFISNKVNKKKASQIDLPLQNILTALDEGKTVVRYNKKQMPIEKAIQQFNKDSRSFSKINKVKTAQINFGGKFDPSQYKDFSPASQKNIADVFKNKNYFLTTTKTRAPSTILKSVVIPGAQSFADFTSSIIDDVAKGAYGRAALKKLGLLGTYFGGKDAVKTLAKGESGAEAVADFLGLKGIAQDAMETASLTPEGRDIKQRTAREQLQKNLQESGFMGGGLDQSGIASLYPTEPDQPVTEAEARQLQTEQDIYGSRKEGIEQLRRQAGDIQLQQFKSKFGIPYDLNREYAYGGRVEMKIGGDPKDKKKTTPALDKPTIPIDPNAPIDPGRRDFMERGVGLGALGGAIATGLVKFAPEIKKAVTGVTTQITEVPNIVKELYFTIRNYGQVTDMSKKGVVKTELGKYTLVEEPGGYSITKMTDSDYRYQQEYFGVQTDPEYGVIDYEELTALPDMDGKLKDVDYGIELDTYREIGEDLAKIRKDDKLIKIADDDIAKQIEKEQALKESLQKKGKGEND